MNVKHVLPVIALLACILAVGAVQADSTGADASASVVAKVEPAVHLALTLMPWLTVAILAIFLPLTAATYYWFRCHRRRIEVERVLRILDVDQEYKKLYSDQSSGAHFAIAVLYTSVLATGGLCLLFLAMRYGMHEFPSAEFGGTEFPRPGSRLVFGMAFLGAYLWGLQNLFHRYVLNDLLPAVYYGLSLRMLVAATTALVIYNAYDALMGDGASAAVSDTVWPALAFMLGMFPQRGVRWLTRRLPLIAPTSDPSVEPVPLEMIQGMNLYDQLRLEEVGIQTCYGLANADFVPLILKTPYGAREIVDWIMQAKLCGYVGGGVKDLRTHGIRTILDLQRLDDEQLRTLAVETSLTENALVSARNSVRGNREVERLCRAGQLLSKYWERNDAARVPDTAPPDDNT